MNHFFTIPPSFKKTILKIGKIFEPTYSASPWYVVTKAEWVSAGLMIRVKVWEDQKYQFALMLHSEKLPSHVYRDLFLLNKPLRLKLHRSENGRYSGELATVDYVDRMERELKERLADCF